MNSPGRMQLSLEQPYPWVAPPPLLLSSLTLCPVSQSAANVSFRANSVLVTNEDHKSTSEALLTVPDPPQATLVSLNPLCGSDTEDVGKLHSQKFNRTFQETHYHSGLTIPPCGKTSLSLATYYTQA